MAAILGRKGEDWPIRRVLLQVAAKRTSASDQLGEVTMTTESAPWVEGLTIGETLRRTAARYPGSRRVRFSAARPARASIQRKDDR